MYEVLFRAEVVMSKEFDLLTREQQRAMLRVLEANPRQQKALTGALRGHYRYRVGDLRVVFSVNDTPPTVTIVAIGRRRNNEIYSTAGGRV